MSKTIIQILALCLFWSCGQQPDAEESYLIAYNVAMNAEQSDYDIWTIDPLSGQKSNITHHPDVAWTYLAVDDKILFVSDRDTSSRCYFLYEMNTDGSGIKKINNFRLRDSWMGSRHDGRELIVTPHPTVDSSFYIINRDGDILDKISTGLPYASDPVFSPDGNQIAFRGGTAKSKRVPGFVDEIYLMNADGSGLQQLSHYPPADTSAPWYAYKAGPPQWHPIKNFVSYQSLQNRKYSLYAVAIDGSKQWKLTSNEMEEGWHAWSPDGRWLAVELFDAKQTQFHIGLMNWQSREMKVLTDTSYAYQQSPVFVTRSR